MSRHSIALAREQLTALDLDAFVSHAATLNQHHCTTFTTPFPKASSRWLSHYQFTPRPLRADDRRRCRRGPELARRRHD